MLLEGIDHVALAVQDVRSSARWYQDVLGLERLYEEAWGDSPAVVGIRGTAIALFPVRDSAPKPLPDGDVIAMRHIAFRANAENFATAQRELSARGLEFEFQDHGISRSIYFRDPDGHVIEITTYALRNDGLEEVADSEEQLPAS